MPIFILAGMWVAGLFGGFISSQISQVQIDKLEKQDLVCHEVYFVDSNNVIPPR